MRLLGSAIVFAGLAYYRPSKILSKRYQKLCKRFAIIDDQIARNELKANFIGDKEIIFPTKKESIQFKYELFLEVYENYSIKQLKQEKRRLEERLEQSKIYAYQKGGSLEIEWE